MTVIVDRNGWNVENNVDGFQLNDIEPILELVDGFMNTPVALLSEDSEVTVSAVSRATAPSKAEVSSHMQHFVDEFNILKESGKKIYLYQIHSFLVDGRFILDQNSAELTKSPSTPVENVVKVRFATV